eukprot:1797342-Rhodomonas_salina.1
MAAESRCVSDGFCPGGGDERAAAGAARDPPKLVGIVTKAPRGRAEARREEAERTTTSFLLTRERARW